MRTVGEERLGLGQDLDPISQRFVLGPQLMNLERTRDNVHDVVGGERLGDVVVRSLAHRFDRVGNRAERRHHHDRHRGVEPLD